MRARSERPGTPRQAARGGRDGGFTLVELIIATAIVAILAGIAMPSYTDYMRRARIVEAATRLAAHRLHMEQYFFDNRRYDDGSGGCGSAPPAPSAADAFAIDCVASTARYTLTATGLPGKGTLGFVFTIDETDARRTTGVPEGWTASRACWVVRRDGGCV